MYEGKNIHFSPVDNKRLCSFSGKVCNQRRLNGYAFCVRHILEDPHAPFKRCAYVAKSSKQTCTQPIPKNEDRVYCNNHMQVLGMLPKKERKPKKEKEKVVPAPQNSAVENTPFMYQARPKARLTVGSFKKHEIASSSGKGPAGLDDPEDPYAFPADPHENSEKKNHVSSSTTTVTVPDLTLVNSRTTTGSNVIPFRAKSPGDSSTNGPSTLAKMYPELAEKLEKIKPKVEPKVKSKVKSSRTMNSLQTKIAQNKIKDKLKRNQESSSTSSQSQSPCHSFNSASSPGFHMNVSSPSVNINTSSPSVILNASSPSVVTSASSPTVKNVPLNSAPEIPHRPSIETTTATATAVASPLPEKNPHLPLNLQNFNLGQLGLPLPTVSELEQTVQTMQQLAKAANIPLDGALLSPEGAPGLLPPNAQRGRPPSAFLTHELLALHHLLRPQLIPQSGPPPPYSSVPRPPFPLPLPVQPQSLPSPSVPPGVTTVTTTIAPSPEVLSRTKTTLSSASLKSDVESVTVATLAVVTKTPPVTASTKTINSNRPSTITSSTQSKALVKQSAKPVSKSPAQSTSTKSSVSIPKLTTSIAKSSTAPTTMSVPPSKLSALSSSKTLTPVAKSTPTLTTLPTPDVPSTKPRPAPPVVNLPFDVVKPRKMKNVLSEEQMRKRLKTESAIQFYENYLKKRMQNHHSLSTGFGSSDDDSDSSDCDMLPWQPEWFTASSDEEPIDEEDLDYGLRTAKLALVRARLRRQCFQSRKAYSANSSIRHSNQATTLSLIKAAKEQSNAAVKCLYEISGNQPKPVDKYKMRGLEKRRCCYRNDEDNQCTNNIVPYTNHCIKHVMYNVDQQLFEYCTAKFSDNTQCCVPVIDVKHELPLCMEHGLKADNYQKVQDIEPKPKRPRKKTKPSALTRPPKKGKKKRNQRKNVRPQKPLPPDMPTGDTEMPDTEEDEAHASTQEEEEEGDGNESMDTADPPDAVPDVSKEEPLPSMSLKPELPQVPVVEVKDPDPVQPVPVPHPAPATVVPVPSVIQKPDRSPEELENLGALPELYGNKMFVDLPLETASKILEENDFQDVLNKMPLDAFDIFNTGKNGEFDVTNEEVEELEKSLALATRDYRYAKESFEQMSTQPLPPILDDADELTKQIAEEILSQNIGPDTSYGSSMCNGDAQESIKAIARSLSSSGMMINSQNSALPGNGLDQGLNVVRSQQIVNQTSVQSQPTGQPMLNHDQVTLLRAQEQERLGSPISVQNLAAQIQAQQGHGQTFSSISGTVPVSSQELMQATFNSAQQQLLSAVTAQQSRQSTSNQNSAAVTFLEGHQLTQQQLSSLMQQQQQQQSPSLHQPTSIPLPHQITQHLQRQQQQLAQQQQQQQLTLNLTPQPSKGQQVNSVTQAVLASQASQLFLPQQGQASVPVSQLVWAQNINSAATTSLTFPNGFPLNSSQFIHNTTAPTGKFSVIPSPNIKDLKQVVSSQLSQFSVPQSVVSNIGVSQPDGTTHGLVTFPPAPAYSAADGKI